MPLGAFWCLRAKASKIKTFSYVAIWIVASISEFLSRLVRATRLSVSIPKTFCWLTIYRHFSRFKWSTQITDSSGYPNYFSLKCFSGSEGSNLSVLRGFCMSLGRSLSWLLAQPGSLFLTSGILFKIVANYILLDIHLIVTKHLLVSCWVNFWCKWQSLRDRTRIFLQEWPNWNYHTTLA